jgi:hypothetical protein
MQFVISSHPSSQELDLLREMIQLQAPPPTPIHPAAVTYKSASAKGATDGRNDWARIQRDKRYRPRLFQWIPHESSSNSLFAARRAYKKALLQPTPQRFTVVARKHVAVDGTRYSLGCTPEQVQADRCLWEATALVQAPDDEAPCYGRCKPVQHGPLLDSSLSRITNAEDLLRVLVVASRGNFLTSASTATASTPYTAAWFQPTERWFSLSMYLASRFEVALWQSYHTALQLGGGGGGDGDGGGGPVPTPPSSWSHTMETQLAAAAIRRAVRQAVADTLALEVLPRDSSRWNYLRDSVLWNILEQAETALQYQDWLLGPWLANTQVAIGDLLDGLLACPLIQVGTPIDHFRRLMRQRVHILLSREMEQTLLQELATDSPVCTVTVPFKEAAKRKNRKKKIKRQKQTLRSSDRVDSLPKVSEVVEKDDESSSGENAIYDASKSGISFPDNGTSARDRNRNTVLVMSILDGVVKEALVKVGLDTTPDTHGDTDSQDGFVNNVKAAVAPKNVASKQRTNPTKVHKGGSRATTAGAQSPWQERGDALFQATEQGTPDSLKSYQPAPSDPPLTTSSNSLDEFSAHYGTHGGGFFHRSEPFDFTWGLTDAAMDDWGRVQGFESRDQSILTEFFPSTHERVDAVITEQAMASSTAASIASSSGKEGSERDIDDKEEDDSSYDAAIETESRTGKIVKVEIIVGESTSGIEVAPLQSSKVAIVESPASSQAEGRQSKPHSPQAGVIEDSEFECRSPFPEEPSTPSPVLSPILLSLADLKGLNQDSLEKIRPPIPLKLPSARSLPPVAQANSLPNSPQEAVKPKMVTNLSRENICSAGGRDTRHMRARVSRSMSEAEWELPKRSAFVTNVKSKDEHDVKGKAIVRRSIDALSPYRSPGIRASKSRDESEAKQARGTSSPRSDTPALHGHPLVKIAATSVSSAKTAGPASSSMKPFNHLHFDSSVARGIRPDGDMCARSDISVDRTPDDQQLRDSRRSFVNYEVEKKTVAVAKDGETTTITSALSHRDEAEDVSALREERDIYRDMCLTLGAEVSKLKNMLAAQKGITLYSDLAYAQALGHPLPDPSAFDPQAVSHYFQNTNRAQTLAAMSDAGFRGEHESQASEDDLRELGGRTFKTETLRHTLSGATIAGSDVSWDHASSHVRHLPPPAQNLCDPVSMNGAHSRLAKDMLKFLEATNLQLRKQNSKRNKAVERMTRLVKAVWPRAQVKLYGSHVTGLCVPSSDLDFVICLPAVHKNAPAVAPGALEGRNAINESSQKLLARKLKGESWIDPRSMKLIERTVVPVIKVATKDTRARTLQLDITFDSPGHHGLEAVDMVMQIMVELPMLRPLVLVLKQFLQDRCLLTAYTGGLSSYCLFLMVARYLQEQPSSFGDCGSLLMGFLDFYGNCVS